MSSIDDEIEMAEKELAFRQQRSSDTLAQSTAAAAAVKKYADILAELRAKKAAARSVGQRIAEEIVTFNPEQTSPNIRIGDTCGPHGRFIESPHVLSTAPKALVDGIRRTIAAAIDAAMPDIIAVAVKAEREACATIAAAQVCEGSFPIVSSAAVIRDRIRARK